MFKMTQDDMIALIERRKWGTLCTVCDDGAPYAIEFTYFLMNENICALINPNGQSASNIARDPRVVFKVCESDDLCERFQAVSCFGVGAFVSDRDEVSGAWDELERRIGLQPGTYARHKARFADQSVGSPLFRLKIERMTGRANWSQE